LLAVVVMGFGVWMSTHHDGCRKSLTLPVLGLGAVIFVVSIIGFLGALKKNSVLLWIYLIMLCSILVAILVFTVLAFIITNNGSGHKVAGLRYKEYQLQDYSSWFLKQTLKEYKVAKLTPIEAGCCRPPSEAGVAQYMKTEWRVVAIFNVVLQLYTLWDAVRDEMQQGTDLKFDMDLLSPRVFARPEISSRYL
ncbi:hypothetical protein C3L33_16011, partial [Rhododendron williamsianum]